MSWSGNIDSKNKSEKVKHIDKYFRVIFLILFSL